MIKGEMAKKAERLTVSIIVLSIVGLILLSILPWISVEENDSIKEDLHFNFEMMTRSSNEQIVNLANDLNLINISFWALIILGLLSVMGATIHASGRFSIVGYLMLLVGCVTLIFSILIINVHIVVLGKIGDINSISASAIYVPFNYAYILLVPSFLIMIFSVAYAWNMSLHSIQKFKGSIKEKKNKKEGKKTTKKLIKKSVETKEKEPSKKESIKPEIDEKRVNMEQWLAGEVRNIEKQTSEEKISEPEEVISDQSSSEEETEESIQDEEKMSIEQSEDLEKKHVFPPEKTKEKSEESDELPLAQSFEKALSSAIQKKQTEIDDLEPLESISEEEKPEKTGETPKEKISVRCPQCKHIFTFDKEGEVTRIKCPECGKEGVVK